MAKEGIGPEPMHDFDKTIELSQSQVVKLGALRPDREPQPCLLVLSGRNVGRLYRLADTTVLGRGQDTDIPLLDEGISRRHAVIESDGAVKFIRDLDSTNGVFVNGQKVARYRLQDGDRIRLGTSTILKFSYHDEVEERFQKQMYDSAVRDAVTGVYNKRFFVENIANEFSYYARHKLPLSVLMIDIDFFKKVNDTYGHPAGDAVLRGVAQLIGKQLRTEDIHCRYGGEEFAVILRTTDATEAELVAERIRKSIEGNEFLFENKSMRVTVSIGVATLDNENYPTPQALVQAADGRLYCAKTGGRNRTVATDL